MLKSLYDYWEFLKFPQLLKLTQNKKLFRDFVCVLILNLIFLSIVSIIHSHLLEFHLIKEYNSFDLLKRYGIQGTVFIACIFAPIVEEIIFRLHLRNRNLNIYFIFSSISLIIASYFFNEVVKWCFYLSFLIFAGIIHIYLSKKSVGRSHRIWMKYYPAVFYFTAVLFGVAHLSNFEDLNISDPVFILYISTQTFAGLGFAYIRIKYGLKFSILLHSSYNMIILFGVIILD